MPSTPLAHAKKNKKREPKTQVYFFKKLQKATASWGSAPKPPVAEDSQNRRGGGQNSLWEPRCEILE